LGKPPFGLAESAADAWRKPVGRNADQHSL
jgi:hypothetical protein